MDPSSSFDLSSDCQPIWPPPDDNDLLFDIDDVFSEYIMPNEEDLGFLDSLTAVDDPSCVVDQTIPIVDSIKAISDDIPINPKEWLIPDKKTNRQRAPLLYEFLILLLFKSHYASYAFFKDRARGIFEISQPDKVAHLWEKVKNRQASQKMTYDKFARAIRWYYKRDIMVKTNSRYTFQFSTKTLACIMFDENNNIVINSPIADSNEKFELDVYMSE